MSTGASSFKEKIMLDYTIMEYNVKQKRYTTVGNASGKDSKEAIANFIEEEEYQRRKDIVLFARIPICR